MVVHTVQIRFDDDLVADLMVADIVPRDVSIAMKVEALTVLHRSLVSICEKVAALKVARTSPADFYNLEEGLVEGHIFPKIDGLAVVQKVDHTGRLDAVAKMAVGQKEHCTFQPSLTVDSVTGHLS